MTFEQTPRGNYIIDAPDFLLSFRDFSPQEAAESDEIGRLVGLVGGVMPESPTKETALYTKADRIWRILNGDFRNAYESLVDQGVVALVAFYDSQKAEHRSDWSTDRFCQE